VTSRLESKWCLRRLSFWTTWGHQMWYVEVFESFKSCIKLFRNLLWIYFVKFTSLWENRFKIGQKNLIWKLHSYFAFWKGLRHDLMSQAHPMHFSIITKNMFWMSNLNLWKIYFWMASHCHNPNIQIPKNGCSHNQSSQKTCQATAKTL
jgi:hypothetical protein